MVGGSVNLRPFSNAVASRWKGKVFYPGDSDWSVARGAANLSLQPGNYVLAQDVSVRMSDGSLFPLVSQGDHVTFGNTTTYTFALVEDSSTANFVICDENGRNIGYLNVPSFGFFREKIPLIVAIDNNMIFQVTARSQERAEITRQGWRFAGLRLDYQLPVVDLEVTE
jgi:molecular chaperone DnaK